MNITQTLELRVNDISIIAKRNWLQGSAVSILPTALERAAIKAEISLDQLITACLNNPALGQYICQVCRKIA